MILWRARRKRGGKKEERDRTYYILAFKTGMASMREGEKRVRKGRQMRRKRACTGSTLFLLWFLEYARLAAQLTATKEPDHTIASDVLCETLILQRTRST